jgi:adenylate cyclase
LRPQTRTWLELASGDTMPLVDTCSIGRARDNQLVLSDEKVSRHHALIRTSEDGECWLVDLASANGTYVNDRRVEQAVLLRDGDAVTIGTGRMVFRSADAALDHHDEAAELDRTVHEVRQLTAWLLLVDVIDSSGIGQRLGPHAMARTLSEWLGRCRETLDARGGILDKPLGDGFFAFWPTAERTTGQVADALQALKQLQETPTLPFRMVLHRGAVFTGSEMASGTYRLFGPEVSFTFRMESLAKALKIDCLLSEDAAGGLSSHVSATLVGSHRLPGVGGPFPFFSL